MTTTTNTDTDTDTLRFTQTLIGVGMAFLDAPDEEHWAHGLAKARDLNQGDVTMTLHAMENAGWLSSRRESTGRSPRRMFRLTPAGRNGLQAVRREARKPPATGGARGPRPHARRVGPYPMGICRVCLIEHKIRDDGVIAGHGANGRKCGRRCDGSYLDPLSPHELAQRLEAMDTAS